MANITQIMANHSVDAGEKIWTSPNTALGLIYGGIGHVAGMAMGKDVSINIGNNAVQFIGNPLGGGAVTLGNTINYFGDADPDKTYVTYEANNRGFIIGDQDYIILGPHEGKHTEQYQNLGPLFLPSYFLSGGIGHNNKFEKEADGAGNEAYKIQNR